MKYLPLVWRNLIRRKTRTTFTVLSIVVAFLLFGILAALNMAFGMGVELAGNDRLIITHKVSIIQLLPESYAARLETTPGVVGGAAPDVTSAASTSARATSSCSARSTRRSC